METSELALGSSSNQLVLEKVLQEVQEVESREQRADSPSAPREVEADLKFRPGFVHLLKDRFALLSLQTDRRASVEVADLTASLKAFPAADGLDLAGGDNATMTPSNLGAARQRSRSTDQLGDGRGVPETANGWMAPALPRDDLHDALDGAAAAASPRTPTKAPPSSIHVFPRANEAKPKEPRLRTGSGKIIIIEAAAGKKTAPRKAPPQETPLSPPAQPPQEAWPCPNIVASTRTLFESSAARHERAAKQPPSPATPAPPPPPSAKAATTPPPRKSRSLFLSSGQVDIVPRSPSSPELQQPRSDSTFSKSGASGASASKRSTAVVSKGGTPVTASSTAVVSKGSTAVTASSTAVVRKGGTPVTASSTAVTKNGAVVGQGGASVNKSNTAESEPVVSVSAARRLFDRPGVAKPRVSDIPKRQAPMPAKSPVPAKVHVPSKASAPTPAPAPAKAPATAKAPAPPIPRTIIKAPAERVAAPVRQVAAPSNGASNDPNAWQSWDDIPKPQRRTFVSEARRVEIPKEQLNASRAKSKSFFFTAVSPANKRAKNAVPEDTSDRTVTIEVEAKAAAVISADQGVGSTRQAERTFWDSYREEEEEEGLAPGMGDPELMEEYRRLMAEAAEGPAEAEPLPSTNIDDVPMAERTRPVAVTKNSQKAEERKKKRLKQRLQFAAPDKLLSIFEYPSERAMIEELGISPDFDLDGAGELSIDDPAAFFGLDDPAESDEVSKSASRLLSGTSALSAGSLSSYKSKSVADEFTWDNAGQRDSSPISPPASDPKPEPEEETPQEEDVQDELTWSSAATADLLF